MGLLTTGKPLTWEESLQYLQYVKEHGIEQFIHIWQQYKDNKNDPVKWGDEIEYILLHLPADNADGVQLSLRSKQIQDDTALHMSTFVNKNSKNNTDSNSNSMTLTDNEKCIVHPEYGSFMIETTPLQPYNDTGNSLLSVETNMLYRREWIESSLHSNERLLSLPAFPTLGVGQYCFPYSPSNGPIAQSKFISDAVINPHPRFATLTQNIRKRRGDNVNIRVPLFKDVNTPENDNEIYMDAMAFGMGCCCLQVTHQASSLEEAKYLNDHLSVLTPILMAMTAATPFLKGQVSDLDCRWTVISQSVDDRTQHELFGQQENENQTENEHNQERINKSRYDTIDSFLSKGDECKCEYEDIDLVYNKKYYDRLISVGVDNSLAKHIAHLFIRDPLAIYSDIITVNDKDSSHHFETIQSTNWQNVRFKPPPPKNENVHNIGWRVEFRSMEVQITEFENAAFSVFITLLTRAMLFYNLNFYINLSKIDENLHLAHQRDAVINEQFWWHLQTSNTKDNCNIEKLSVKDIVCGSNENRGLLAIVIDYINNYKDGTFYNESEKKQLFEYLDFIKQRANGDIMTGAQWLRQYAVNHKLYKKDSIISEALCRDIVDVLDDIVHGKRNVPALLGESINIDERRKLKIELEIPKIGKNVTKSKTQTKTSQSSKNTQSEFDINIVGVNRTGTAEYGIASNYNNDGDLEKSYDYALLKESPRGDFDDDIVQKNCCSRMFSYVFG